MPRLAFTKMHGAGNDFVVVDDRAHQFPTEATALQALSDRRRGIGCDGFLLIRTSAGCDFAMVFYNPDGSRAEMCANGARCIARYAVDHEIAPARHCFATDAGVVQASVAAERVRLALPLPTELSLRQQLTLCNEGYTVHAVNTGVPHAVVFVPDVATAPLEKLGPALRFHPAFAPAGANANLVAIDGKQMQIRTYERGVEAETLACGTGVTAAAWIAHQLNLVAFPLSVCTRGGDVIDIDADETAVWHTGPTAYVYHGEVMR